MDSPFMGQLCSLFAERLQGDDRVSETLLGWPRLADPRKDAVPLRIAGALHALVLEGRDPELSKVFPPNAAQSDDALWNAISSAIVAHQDFILERLNSAPQTNEVSRAAILLPGFMAIASRFAHPLVLSEIGASAGLNLFWDRFGYRLGSLNWGDANAAIQLAPEWHGAEPDLQPIRVASRGGCDLNPLDPSDDSDRVRLLSYVWADQAERLARTRAALGIASSDPARVDGADAVDWLQPRLAKPRAGETHVIFHTIVWPYLSPDAQAEGEALIRKAGSNATESAPLAWLRFEPDQDPHGGGVTLTLWPGGGQRLLGRADFHGRWVDWTG